MLSLRDVVHPVPSALRRVAANGFPIIRRQGSGASASCSGLLLVFFGHLYLMRARYNASILCLHCMICKHNGEENRLLFAQRFPAAARLISPRHSDVIASARPLPPFRPNALALGSLRPSGSVFSSISPVRIRLTCTVLPPAGAPPATDRRAPAANHLGARKGREYGSEHSA